MNKLFWLAVLLPGIAAAADRHAESFAENFRQVDSNHDGRLSMAETEKNAPGLAMRFALIDANRDGFLSEKEIHDFVQAFVREQRKKFAQRFKDADKNGNGSLSREEAKALPGVFAHYDEMDADKNGELTQREIGEYAKQRAAERRQAREADDVKQ